MAKNILRLAMLACVLVLAACSIDFDLTSKWKDVTVVYGLLDPSDTAQYIKINRAFLDPKTNAVQLAAIPDSTYYPNLDVKLEEYNGSGQLTNTIPLTKVDGNLEGMSKPSGVFPQSPNWLYKTKHPLDISRTYKLVITKNDNNQITAQTALVGNITVTQPHPPKIGDILPVQNATFLAEWSKAANAAFYGLSIRFNYVEYPDGDPADSVAHSIEWREFSSYVPEFTASTTNYAVTSLNLYVQMASQIPVTAGVTRKARSMDFTFAAGGTELYTYYLVTNAQEGITSGQIAPQYTNLSGSNIGVFSSRTFKTISHLGLNTKTLYAMDTCSITQPLNFQN